MDLTRLRVVAITDRRLMGGDIVAAIRRALDGTPAGSVAIQVREKDLDGGALLSIARAVVAAATPFGAPTFVNDRVDVALAAGADGVHLPEAGMSVADARAIAPSLVVGVSRHTHEAAVDEARRGEVDLVQLGPLHDSPGKGDQLGIRAFQFTARELAEARGGRTCPRLVAVGGVDVFVAGMAVAAGADAVAMIRAAWRGQSLAPFVAEIDRAR